jgi:hypothetical protein
MSSTFLIASNPSVWPYVRDVFNYAPQSGLSGNIREIRACFAYFAGK